MKDKEDFEQRIARAITDVKEGMVVRRAADRYGLVESTLSRRLRITQSRQKAFEIQQRLTPEQEKYIVDWISREEACGRAPSNALVAAFAQSILADQGDLEPLGINWVYKFRKRHNTVLSKIGRPVDSSRIHMSDEQEIRDFYPLLAGVRAKYNITAKHEYNMDETGLQEGETDKHRVLGTSHSHRVRVSKSEASTWVTIIEYVSLEGDRGCPVVIYKGKKLQAQWFGQDVIEWEYTASPKGWTNNVIANRWLEQVFLVETKPRMPGQYRLLILDGHSTHVSAEFMWKAYQEKVILLYLPAHASDEMQPLDVGVLSPLKVYFRQEMRLFASYLATAPIYKQRMLQAYINASQKAFSSHNIISGWRESGLWPLDVTKVLPPPPTPPPRPSAVILHDTPPYEPPKDIYVTPKGPRELSSQLREIEKNTGPISRDIRNLVGKAGKALALHTAHIAKLRADNLDLRLQLDAYTPDIRQTVHPDPNKVFASLPEIRDAQSKRERRLPNQPLPDEVIGDCIVVKVDHKNKKQ